MSPSNPTDPRAQLAAYAEPWKRHHDEAMQCWELENFLQNVALPLFRSIQTIDAHWSDEVRSGRATPDDATAASLRDYYAEWFAASPAIGSAIRQFEAAGYSVKGAEAFREACRHAEMVLSFAPERVRDSMVHAQQRNGRPLGEVMGELRNRNRA